MQANLSNDGTLSAVGNYRWRPGFVTKANAQVAPGQGMLQLENDVEGKDFSASLKALNPSALEGGMTGIFIGSYLQSVTPRLSLGLEAIWQRIAMNQGPDTAISYVARYEAQDWILSGQLQTQGALNTSFYRRLSDKVSAGVDLQMQIQPGPGGDMLGARKEGTATIGAKYDFRASTMRAQVDSTGKVSCMLEKRVLPPVQITFAGEIDQVKVRNESPPYSHPSLKSNHVLLFQQSTKIGLAVSLELPASEEILEQQEKQPELLEAQPPPF